MSSDGIEERAVRRSLYIKSGKQGSGVRLLANKNKKTKAVAFRSSTKENQGLKLKDPASVNESNRIEKKRKKEIELVQSDRTAILKKRKMTRGGGQGEKVNRKMKKEGKIARKGWESWIAKSPGVLMQGGVFFVLVFLC